MNVTGANQGASFKNLFTNYGQQTVDVSYSGELAEDFPKETVSFSPQLEFDDDDVADLLLAQPEIVPPGTTERALAKMKPEIPGVFTMEFWTSDRWHNQMP